MEEKDFQLYDKLQRDTVKKLYEVRILKLQKEKEQGVRERGRIIWLSALCLDLDFSIQLSKSKKKRLGWRLLQRVGDNVNQCGMGVQLSESALSAWHWKTF